MEGLEPYKKMILVWNEVGSNVGSSFRVKEDQILAVKNDGHLMIHGGVREQLELASDGAGPGFPGGENQTRHPSVDQGSGAHSAGL